LHSGLDYVRLNTLNRRVIFLAEDNPIDVKLAQRALRQYGIDAELIVATDGQEALEMLEDGSLPDLIVLDVNMPRNNGFQVLERVRGDEKTRHLPVVMFSTSDEPSDMARAIEMGANSYVRKPQDFDESQQTLRDMFNYWLEVHCCPKAG
jgi:two-component system, response regulator